MNQDRLPDPGPKSGIPAAAAPSTPSEPASLSSGETVYYEGGPARGDLVLSLLIGLTVIGLPIAVGAIVRALWLRYRITSRRISVSGGWLGRDRTQVVYSQIQEVLSVPRGFGAWGDMVLVLNDGSRLEMRSVPRFRELEAFIEERRQARASAPSARSAPGFG
ncbi:MAG: PH domain-containing protein, partial [Cyanobium sp. ELA712]